MTSHKFDELCNRVKFCTRCPRMDDSARVLSRAAGPLDAPVMFIGEAPGRLGADASEIPFHGDKAGHNFEELLEFSGLDRSRIFVTNSALCNPRDANGNNATPSKAEVKNCSSYLQEQIELVNPKIVITLGAVALQAVSSISPHSLELSSSVRTAHRWNGRLLIPLYHPGTRAMIHRSMANQRADYQFVAEQLTRHAAPNKQIVGTTRKAVADAARIILSARQEVSYFALHKLLYLIECQAWSSLGHPVTTGFFLRQKDGPYCTDLHLTKLRRAIPELLVDGPVGRPILHLRSADLFGRRESQNPELEAIAEQVLVSTKNLSDAQLKSRVYMSTPMRAMLRIEKTQLLNLYNAPINFNLINRDRSEPAAA